MTFEDFNQYQAKLLEEVVAMKDTKGKEYANSKSRFANFDRSAAKNGIDRLIVANIFFTKHIDAIDSYIKNRGKIYSTESIRSRIVDAITYLTLIGGMIEEVENNKYSTITISPGHTSLEYLSDNNSGKQQPFEYDPT